MSSITVLFVATHGATGGATAAAVGADPAVSLIGRAADLAEGAGMFDELKPQVVVLYGPEDHCPARAAFEASVAQQGGAVVSVVAGCMDETFDVVRRKVRAAGETAIARPGFGASRSAGAAKRPGGRRIDSKLIAIGASTGGVEALVEVLSEFPADCPPTVLVQHMPALFTTSFAARLNTVSPATVREAWDGAPLERGVVYLAPGGASHLEISWGATRACRLVESAPVNRHRPSVDVTFHCVARLIGAAATGVLLTGMGRDGAEGLRAMREAGARTFAQDQASSTVYGMPRAAHEIGAVDCGTPLSDVVSAIFYEDQAQREAV